MECTEAAPYISALYDGESIPRDIAEHIDTCVTCRASLDSYSQIGAEMRLLASREAATPTVPQAVLDKIGAPGRPVWFASLRRRMLVPRFAVVAAAFALITASAGLVVVRAQNQTRSYWFQFRLAPPGAQSAGAQPLGYQVGKAGTDEAFVWMGLAHDGNGRPIPTEMEAIGMHYAISSIEDGRVRLRIRAQKYSVSDPAVFNAKQNLPLGAYEWTYKPGEPLEIPVEGGGTLVLTGQITETQPKLAWGLPVEPNPDQLVLTQPVVIRGNTVLVNMEGGSSASNGFAGTIMMSANGFGRLTIGLRPFDKAVRGEATWGKLTFKWAGEKYTVLSASPISGGEQPHEVWVALDPEGTLRPGSTAAIGSSSQE